MKLIINTASTYKGGGVQVARSFIEECKKYEEHQYHVVLGNMLSQLVDQNEYPENYHFYKIGYRPATRVLSFKERDTFFKNLEGKVKPDIVFTTSGPSYWRPKVPHLIGYNLPHYVYRDSPFFSKLSWAEKIKWDLKGAVIKYFFKQDADAYVVQTDDVNRRLRNLLDLEEVYTVSNTVNHFYQNQIEADNKLPEKGNDEFRFLTLSAWYKHKNLEIIPSVIDAMADDLKANVRFVLTISEEKFQEKVPAKYHHNIINVGPVKPDEGPSLYKECDALFLPTLLECFSASYAEAMAMEKPILTSDLGFAKTVCENAALYVDPMDAEEISKAVKKLVTDSELRHELCKNGKRKISSFVTAEERAEAYLNICEDLLVDGKKN